jgi:tetratricopeptide (TPR) repeat protein
VTDVLPPRYADAELIARGGMADVYHAHDRELARPVAVKLLSYRFAGDATIRRRFTREALAAARMSGHPHIVTIYDVGEWDARPFIVMEYLPGGTLADRIAAGPVAHEDAVRWLAAAAAAIDAAHAAGVVHRDIKPANLIFDVHGSLQVADFGIARVLDESTNELTAAGTVLGTAGYVSPERARGEGAVPASDVYSLGVVAFELLTGSRPFARGSDAEEAAAHVNDRLPAASSRDPALPPAVNRVFGRCLAKQPDDRYPDARSFVAALERALASSAPPAAVSAAPTAPPERRRRSTRAAALALLAAAGLAAGGVAAVLASDDPPARAVDVLTVTDVRTTEGEVRTVTVERTVPADAPPTTTATEPPPPATEPPPPATEPAPAADVTTGHQLNDQGFALMGQERYAEALPLLERAVDILRGVGPADPFEGYATYNLGVTLTALGRCDEALAPLRRSQRLQRERPEPPAAIAQAKICRNRSGGGSD